MKRIFERLVSVHLIERREDELDDLGHFTWHWTYPTIDGHMRSFIEKRLFSRYTHPHESNSDSFDFYHLKSRWVYLKSSSSNSSRNIFILLTTDFCPQTYGRLLDLFGQLLEENVPLRRFLHYYLELLIHGQVVVSELAGDTRFSLRSCDENADALHASRDSIKTIIKLFHLDVILIYTALLLRRRIAIYHYSQSALLDFMCALPAFVSHRTQPPSDALYPNVDLHSQEQIDCLQEQTHFIATFHDPKIEECQELYDIYINLAAVEITISHKAREVFSMTKTHKEVAIALVRVAENDSATSEQVIHEILKKTEEIRNALYLLMRDEDSPEPNRLPERINKAKLKQKLLSPNLESFYWNFALAEGIADDTCW